MTQATSATTSPTQEHFAIIDGLDTLDKQVAAAVQLTLDSQVTPEDFNQRQARDYIEEKPVQAEVMKNIIVNRRIEHLKALTAERAHFADLSDYLEWRVEKWATVSNCPERLVGDDPSDMAWTQFLTEYDQPGNHSWQSYLRSEPDPKIHYNNDQMNFLRDIDDEAERTAVALRFHFYNRRGESSVPEKLLEFVRSQNVAQITEEFAADVRVTADDVRAVLDQMMIPPPPPESPPLPGDEFRSACSTPPLVDLKRFAVSDDAAAKAKLGASAPRSRAGSFSGVGADRETRPRALSLSNREPGDKSELKAPSISAEKKAEIERLLKEKSTAVRERAESFSGAGAGRETRPRALSLSNREPVNKAPFELRGKGPVEQSNRKLAIGSVAVGALAVFGAAVAYYKRTQLGEMIKRIRIKRSL